MAGCPGGEKPAAAEQTPGLITKALFIYEGQIQMLTSAWKSK